jgi:hypothetical protein
VGDLEVAGDHRAGGRDLAAQHDRARGHAAGAHVLGEGGQCLRLAELRLGHEGAAAVHPVDQALAGQLVDRLGDGRPGDLVALGQLAL